MHVYQLTLWREKTEVGKSVRHQCDARNKAQGEIDNPDTVYVGGMKGNVHANLASAISGVLCSGT